MSKEETIQMQGEIVETLPNATFRVRLHASLRLMPQLQSLRPDRVRS